MRWHLSCACNVSHTQVVNYIAEHSCGRSGSRGYAVTPIVCLRCQTQAEIGKFLFDGNWSALGRLCS